MYVRGPGRNGGGGHYELFSGTFDRVQTKLLPGYYDIYHTHPRGSRFASPQDMRYLEALIKIQQDSGIPMQESSRVIPVNRGAPFRYSVGANNIGGNPDDR
jgi:hypothetical protein